MRTFFLRLYWIATEIYSYSQDRRSSTIHYSYDFLSQSPTETSNPVQPWQYHVHNPLRLNHQRLAKTDRPLGWIVGMRNQTVLAWYDDYRHDKRMNIATIKQGFWATQIEMAELWNSIENEMYARKVLSRNTATLMTLQNERCDAVKAGIEAIAHFKNMMCVINCHGDYKDRMTQALSANCLKRYQAWAAKTPTKKLQAKPVTKKPMKKLPAEPVTVEKKPPDVALGFQTISIGINGVEYKANYLPLHLVPEDKGLRKLNLASDEMKARVQPEDLSFDLLINLVAQDCQIEGQILVTCPELEEDILNERNFQLAVYTLLTIGLKLKFMFSNRELVRQTIL